MLGTFEEEYAFQSSCRQVYVRQLKSVDWRIEIGLYWLRIVSFFSLLWEWKYECIRDFIRLRLTLFWACEMVAGCFGLRVGKSDRVPNTPNGGGAAFHTRKQGLVLLPCCCSNFHLCITSATFLRGIS